MHAKNRIAFALMAVCMLALAGCASLNDQDPVEVFMVGAESLPGEGMEVRMLVKLRVQNPNEMPLDYSGVHVKLDVMGKSFASGVNSVSGSVPGFGESIVEVPVSVSIVRIVRQFIGLASGNMPEKLAYDMSGKLSGSGKSRSVRFKSKGEFDFPIPGEGTKTDKEIQL